MRTNVAAKSKVVKTTTHEGAPAIIPKSVAQLSRQVATCMLFENTFYESGSTIAASIAKSCREVDPQLIADVAIQARGPWKLRHVPLFLLAQLDLRRGDCVPPSLVSRTIERVVQRPDEMGELLSIIQKVNGGKPLKKCLSAQVKKGLGRVFAKFNEYQIAKWNQDAAVKLRDVLFLTHARPKDKTQAKMWKKLIDGKLAAPDTWEVALSAGKDKKATWERLLGDDKLGYMALLMNLRNMTEAGVDRKLVKKALVDGAPQSRALPFRFLSAAKAAPGYTDALDEAMRASLTNETKLPGMTYTVIDVSGSMDVALSDRGQLTRLEAASALAVLLREVCEDVRVFTFSYSLCEVMNSRGISMLTAISNSQQHGGTALAGSMRKLLTEYREADRIIVVTDEQSGDGGVPPLKVGNGYLINVAPYVPGLQVSGGWTRISGWSERVVDFVRYEEGLLELPEEVKPLAIASTKVKVKKKVAPKTRKTVKKVVAKKAVTKKVVKKAIKKVAKKSVKRTAC